MWKYFSRGQILRIVASVNWFGLWLCLLSYVTKFMKGILMLHHNSKGRQHSPVKIPFPHSFGLFSSALAQHLWGHIQVQAVTYSYCGLAVPVGHQWAWQACVTTADLGESKHAVEIHPTKQAQHHMIPATVWTRTMWTATVYPSVKKKNASTFHY